MKIRVKIDEDNILVFYSMEDVIKFSELRRFFTVCQEFINIGEGK